MSKIMHSGYVFNAAHKLFTILVTNRIQTSAIVEVYLTPSFFRFHDLFSSRSARKREKSTYLRSNPREKGAGVTNPAMNAY